VAAVLLLVLFVLTVLVIAFAPTIVTLIAPGFVEDPQKLALTVTLFRIMFPYLACMSLTAMLAGVLNAHRRFFVAALAPTLLNLFSIAALGIGILGGFEAREIGYIQSVAVLAAGIGQLLMVALAARAVGFRMGLRAPRLTPNVKRLLWLAAPTAAAGGITQINLFIGQIIASGKDGAIAILQYADRLYQLPLGVVGVAVGVVLLPELSRTLRAGADDAASGIQNRSLEFALFLTLPAATALAVFAGPIVSVLYERGAFGAEAAAATAAALRVYGLGLPAFVMIKVFMPGYYAREDTRTPMAFALVSAAVNVTLALLLFPRLAEAGIAAAESVAGWANALLLAGTLARRGHFAADRALARRLAGVLAASLALGAVLGGGAWAAAPYMSPAYPFPVRFAILIALLGAAGLVYLALAQATGAADLREIARNLRRRRKADPAPTPEA